MKNLSSTFQLKGHLIRNRIVLPPVVCFHYSDHTGIVTDRNVDHYQLRSTGPGIVITEATAVREEGRLASFQLGLWSDDHIPGMSRIAETVKANGALSLVQIHHAGLITPETVNAVALAPSVDEKNPRSRELTIDEIRIIRDSFIAAAVRAKKAGYDGVELHGAHGYLLNQFANSTWNRRKDEYGGDFTGRLKLATEIIRGIRTMCGDAFIIGYRMGTNTPTLEDGIATAKYLESLGIDIIHPSHGGNLMNLPRPPKDFEYNWIVFAGITIKQHLNIPVIVVNEIKTPERAEWLVENGHTDFVALARPLLADPKWTDHVLNGQPVHQCLSCKPRCRWYEDSRDCPAEKARNRVNA